MFLQRDSTAIEAAEILSFKIIPIFQDCGPVYFFIYTELHQHHLKCYLKTNFNFPFDYMNKKIVNFHIIRELRMPRFYLKFLHKMSFLIQMVQKVTEFEFFRIKTQKSL